MDLQRKLSVGGSNMTSDVICELAKGFFSSFEVPASENTAEWQQALNRTITLYCEANDTAILMEMSSKLNIDYLLTQVRFPCWFLMTIKKIPNSTTD